jgi:hypothetical protein
MFNFHLLDKELTVEMYEALSVHRYSSDSVQFLNELPIYIIARCPYCLAENSERLDTYSVEGWNRNYGKNVYHFQAVVNRCEHFALVEPFFHFHGLWPDEAMGLFGPEKPHVIGYLLENKVALAVIHALPICRIEDSRFVPRYTLFMITYFSENPGKTYESMKDYNRRYTDEPYTPFPFEEPSYDEQHWWDLPLWVSKGLLFWLDGTDPALPLKTGKVDAFPYGDVEGRRFSHRFPYPL